MKCFDVNVTDLHWNRMLKTIKCRGNKQENI